MANHIHPTAIVGAGVELGDGNVVGPYTVICGPTRVGDGNWIGPHVCIGGPAEYLAAPHPASWTTAADVGDAAPAGAGVVLGHRSRIREFVTINQGVHEPTRLGDDCYLMGRSHLGHDTAVDAGVVLASAVQLAGHVRVGSWANLGLGTVVHQHARIGPGAMVGMGAAVRRDVPPFTIAVGNPARAVGVNEVGLRRLGCDEATVAAVAAYLAGRGELPLDLPAELGERLVAWTKTDPDPATEPAIGEE